MGAFRKPVHGQFEVGRGCSRGRRRAPRHPRHGHPENTVGRGPVGPRRRLELRALYDQVACVGIELGVAAAYLGDAALGRAIRPNRRPRENDPPDWRASDKIFRKIVVRENCAHVMDPGADRDWQAELRRSQEKRQHAWLNRIGSEACRAGATPQ